MPCEQVDLSTGAIFGLRGSPVLWGGTGALEEPGGLTLRVRSRVEVFTFILRAIEAQGVTASPR